MLTGEAKKAYQREYMKKRRSNKANVRPDVRPDVRPVRVILGLTMDGNRITGVERRDIESRRVDDVRPELPLCTPYNVRQFKVGDRVRVKRGRGFIETVVPELDAEGNPIWR